METEPTTVDTAAEIAPATETAPRAVSSPPWRLGRTTPAQIVLVVLGVITFLYFARPVLLPIFLACIASMTLKPLVGWMSRCRLPNAVSAAVVLFLLVATVGSGFSQLGRPALQWINEAPEHVGELRHRLQQRFPRIGSFNEALAALSNFGATEDEKKTAQDRPPTVAVRLSNDTGSILNWTRSLLVGVGETLVLLYLLLSSGDLFAQKLVHVMPTWRDKKRAVEINREIQLNISHYLFSVTLINLGLGMVAGIGFCFMDVPNAAMWGMMVMILNYVPYFGPIIGITVLATVGLLTFETLPRALLPPGWYLLLHLLEANLITPVLLGLRFTLNPVAIFISLIFWTWLWGVPGALLSVPILVSIKVVCDRVKTLSPVSEMLTH